MGRVGCFYNLNYSWNSEEFRCCKLCILLTKFQQAKFKNKDILQQNETLSLLKFKLKGPFNNYVDQI